MNSSMYHSNFLTNCFSLIFHSLKSLNFIRVRFFNVFSWFAKDFIYITPLYWN